MLEPGSCLNGTQLLAAVCEVIWTVGSLILIALGLILVGFDHSSAVDVQKLFAGLSVQRTAHGGLMIEAPPETALTLAALFAGMAQLLQAAAPAPAPQPATDSP